MVLSVGGLNGLSVGGLNGLSVRGLILPTAITSKVHVFASNNTYYE